MVGPAGISADSRPVIVPIGGFLGAGKTSLILAASRILAKRGIKSAAILNDQGAELVDTLLVRSEGVLADQVTGGCFCCRFGDLVDAAHRLRAYQPDVIFAEAVGSCTDISATTLQPLKLYHADAFALAPYTVLVDPARAKDLAASDAEPDFAFLFQKQVEEADLVCFTKSDLNAQTPEITSAPVRYLSSHTEKGIDAWLQEVLAGNLAVGCKILDIDYQHYARAEARLAWLNCRLSLTLEIPLSPALVAGPLLDDLDEALTAEGFRVAHLKVTDSSAAGFIQASLTRNGEEPVVRGNLDASPADVHELLLNVRAAGDAARLRQIVEQHLGAIPGKLETHVMQCFHPAAPQPEHRLATVVG